jgi:hypothetical protein
MPFGTNNGQDKRDDGCVNGFEHEAQAAHDEQLEVETAERKAFEPGCNR